jgi:hypothetical protein
LETALDHAKKLIGFENERSKAEKVNKMLAEGKTMDKAMDILYKEILNQSNQQNVNMILGNELFFNDWKNSRDANISHFSGRSRLQEFETLQEATSVLHKKNEKIESKLALLTGGFKKRCQNISSSTTQTFYQLQNAATDKTVFDNLQKREELSAVTRIDHLISDINCLRDDEKRLKLALDSLEPLE